MYRKFTAAVLLLALASAAAAQPKAKGGPTRACEPGEPAFWRDQGLTTKVATKLKFHKPLFRESFGVKVTGGAAILSGNVSSQALIAEAVRTAAGVGGVKCVLNYLEVGPTLPIHQ